MELPHSFLIRESSHRILNPFTAEKLATLGAALRLPPGTRLLDLCCGKGELLCTWARSSKELAAVLSGTDVRIVLAGHTHVVSAGALAGIPVWTGGTTAFASGAFPAGGGESRLLSPAANRVDLFDDSLIGTTVAMDAEHVATLTPAEVDDLIASIDR